MIKRLMTSRAVVAWAFAILAALAYQLFVAVENAREAARRSSCLGNLNQWTLAVANYETAHQRFPPLVSPNGFSWRVAILPMFDRNGLFGSLDHSTAWNSTSNTPFHLPVPSGLKCHNREDATADTQMFAVTAPNSIWKDCEDIYDKITDRRSETLVMIELDLPGVNWMSPQDVSLSKLVDILHRDGRLPSSHPDGVLMSFADITVRCIPHHKITPEFLQAIVSIDGGEEVTID